MTINHSMIALETPLSVMSQDHVVGHVTALNNNALAITWTHGAPSSPCLATITLGSGTKVTLLLKYASKVWEPNAPDQKPLLVDLVHRIRKGQHIQICAEQDVEHSQRDHGFAGIRLPHVALPELSWSDISTERRFMGQKFAAPFLITGMTGGIDLAATINHRLAEAATAFNIPMGVGSQRIALENSAHAEIFTLKKQHPKLFLIGNLGIGQLRESNFLDFCKRAVEMIDADALAIHVNVLQELVQVEGDRDFRGILDRIADIVRHVHCPVLVKEVGTGMDLQTIHALHQRGVRHIDVGGSGGTSWAHIEGLRAQDPIAQRLGKTFRDWGISTAEALQQAIGASFKDLELVATGGMRDGVTALKALHVGATMVGVGLPLFRAAMSDANGPQEELRALIQELKIAMICSGRSSL